MIRIFSPRRRGGAARAHGCQPPGRRAAGVLRRDGRVPRPHIGCSQQNPCRGRAPDAGAQDGSRPWGAARNEGRQPGAHRRPGARGGLAGVVLEIAETARTDITINEGSVPVRKEVRVTCELMGFDPLYLANEGKMVIVAAESAAGSILDFFKKKKLSRLASIIGRIGSPSRKPEVNLRTKIGGMRRIEKLSGEQLPRIC